MDGGRVDGWDTYSLCNGEHFPASGVDRDQSRRLQLLTLRYVAIYELVDTDL